jgi:hypothetical protein
MRRTSFLAAVLSVGFLQMVALAQEGNNPIALPISSNAVYWLNVPLEVALTRDKTLPRGSDEKTLVAGKDSTLKLSSIDPDHLRTRTVSKGEVVFALKGGSRSPVFGHLLGAARTG